MMLITQVLMLLFWLSPGLSSLYSCIPLSSSMYLPSSASIPSLLNRYFHSTSPGSLFNFGSIFLFVRSKNTLEKFSLKTQTHFYEKKKTTSPFTRIYSNHTCATHSAAHFLPSIYTFTPIHPPPQFVKQVLAAAAAAAASTTPEDVLRPHLSYPLGSSNSSNSPKKHVSLFRGQLSPLSRGIRLALSSLPLATAALKIKKVCDAERVGGPT